MKKWMLTLAMMPWMHFASAQVQLTGQVQDAESGLVLPLANVVLENTSKSTFTNTDGRFAFPSLAKGDYKIKISFVGYEIYRAELNLSDNLEISINLKPETRLAEEVIVTATRASERTASTYTDIKKVDLQKQNLGQDLPFLLNQTPSVVITSDAGAGVGYTGIRIRGSDPTRINVTVNGIPLNDSESHGVFWVNMPDFASSVDNIQIQRGVGTSTNGAAAFGATVNIQTETLNKEAYASLDNSVGSFNTRKHTVKVGSGLINNRFAFDARLSSLYSDGFVDRAFSDLKSYFISGGYYGEKTIIKANIFSGKEHTYQSWYGLPESKLKDDRTFNYYTYENETDNYQQNHYQLILAHEFASNLTLNGAIHFTKGAGYYEQFREDDDFENYGLPNIQIGDSIISSTDLVRQRWLDNYFVGFTTSVDYQINPKAQLVVGGAWNRYDGEHFGEIIWAQITPSPNVKERYYFNNASKKDYHAYAKLFYNFSDKLVAFGDVQWRGINYYYDGLDNDQRFINGNYQYNFINPKLGVSYNINAQQQLYASYSVGNREPVRNDFIDAATGKTPKHETLRNLEAGYKWTANQFSAQGTAYLMDYKNHLVLTGELNDVGSPIRTNVDKSYRAGVELQAAFSFGDILSLSGNVSLSQNKIAKFTEVLYDYYDNGDVLTSENIYNNSDVSFSPNIVAGGIISTKPINGLELTLLSKYVGSQFLDNTSNNTRKLDAFFVNDVRATYNFSLKGVKRIGLSLLVNNILNHKYESSGYTFSYGYEGTVFTENYYYPQAGTNFLAGLSLNF